MSALSKYSGAEVFLAVIIVAIGVVAIFAFHGWLLMLLWGGIAAAIGWQTIGYGTAVLFSLLITLVFGSSSINAKRK